MAEKTRIIVHINELYRLYGMELRKIIQQHAEQIGALIYFENDEFTVKLHPPEMTVSDELKKAVDDFVIRINEQYKLHNTNKEKKVIQSPPTKKTESHDK